MFGHQLFNLLNVGCSWIFEDRFVEDASKIAVFGRSGWVIGGVFGNVELVR